MTEEVKLYTYGTNEPYVVLGNDELTFFEDEAKTAVRNFLQWILKNRDNFKDVSLYDFVNNELKKIGMEEADE